MGLPIAYLWLADLSRSVMNKARANQNELTDRTINNSDVVFSNGRKESVNGTAQDTYLLPKWLQKTIFLLNGYIEGNPGDYGLVKKAVGNRNIPIYQTAPDETTRDNLTVVGNDYGMSSYIEAEKDLYHAGDFPTAFYLDQDGNFFAKSWDLNDYGNSNGRAGTEYGSHLFAANMLDKIGSPVVVTTGYQPVKAYWSNSVNEPSNLNLNNIYMNPVISEIFENFAKTHHMRQIDGKWETTTDKDLIVTPNGNYWK